MILFALACTAELAEDRAFVLLDADARELGWRLVVDDELFAPVLPVVVEAGAPVTLEGPADEVELLLDPGELAWIDGAGNAAGGSWAATSRRTPCSSMPQRTWSSCWSTRPASSSTRDRTASGWPRVRAL